MSLFYKVIGLMSGTSMDGLDMVFCHLTEINNSWSFQIIHAHTEPYPLGWLSKLNSARGLSDSQLNSLSRNYGTYLASCVRQFISNNAIGEFDFVASHGHTVHHQPEKGVTVQIGDGQQLANLLGIPVVNDFRTSDVLMGGQGAPLVPIGDKLLFGSFQACLNLGGFSNISFTQNDKRVAFDISPANIILNHICNKLDLAYDKDGVIAKSGSVIPNLLIELNNLSYYNLPVPKSLGIEWVESCVYPLIDSSFLEKDVLRTFVEHITFQISRVLNEKAIGNILVTGGGTFNSFLIQELKLKTDTAIVIPENEVVNFKEALVFAFLGVLKWENRINILGSVTGAGKDHSSGQIHLPDPMINK